MPIFKKFLSIVFLRILQLKVKNFNHHQTAMNFQNAILIFILLKLYSFYPI